MPFSFSGNREHTVADVLSGQIAQKNKRGRPEGGISAAARKLGIERTAVRRAMKVASLSDEASDVARATGLDSNRSALLKAANEKTPEAQVAKLREIAQTKASGSNAFERQVLRLATAWDKASPEVRNWFLGLVTKPNGN
jgi:ParB family chromosome partitioning protein